MTLTITWGRGSSARTWSLGLPAALAKCFSVPAGCLEIDTAAVKRALGMAEPFLVLAAEAVGAGIPELLLLVGAVTVANEMLSPADPSLPGPAPPSSRRGSGPTLTAA